MMNASGGQNVKRRGHCGQGGSLSGKMRQRPQCVFGVDRGAFGDAEAVGGEPIGVGQPNGREQAEAAGLVAAQLRAGFVARAPRAVRGDVAESDAGRHQRQRRFGHGSLRHVVERGLHRPCRHPAAAHDHCVSVDLRHVMVMHVHPGGRRRRLGVCRPRDGSRRARPSAARPLARNLRRAGCRDSAAGWQQAQTQKGLCRADFCSVAVLAPNVARSPVLTFSVRHSPAESLAASRRRASVTPAGSRPRRDARRAAASKKLRNVRKL